MLALDFKILLLGADIDAISMIHYSEQRFNVPYRYWKDFTGRVKTPGGWEERTYRMYVRDMALDPKLTLHPVRAYLIEHDQYHSVPLNYGDVSLVQMRHFVPAVDYFLAKNPYSLMLNRPDM
jgi:aminoglycoside 3-N-acetyltransferase